MELWPLLSEFMPSIRNNPKMTAYHVSVYVALLYYCQMAGDAPSFTVFSREVLSYAKLLKPGTYHRIMKDLHEFGYIVYTPSHSPVLGSLVQLKNLN
jgi:hypothetical protein